jgi:hypothetical protein
VCGAREQPNGIVATLQAVLKQAQESWRTADAELRILKFERANFDAKPKTLKTELETSSCREADSRRDARSLPHVQPQLIHVQTDIVVERTKVSELKSELAEAKSQLKDWKEQYEWQYRAEAGADERPIEEKNPTARRLSLPGADEEPPRTPPPRPRPEESGSASSNLRSKVAFPASSQVEVLSATAAKFKEAERIRVVLGPSPHPVGNGV